MSGQSAVTATPIIPDFDLDDDEPTFADPQHDESEFDVKRRERNEQRDAETLVGLHNVKSRRRVYREEALLCLTRETAKFLTLSYLLDQADTDLDNSFKSRKTVATALHCSLNAYELRMRWLEARGWIRRHEFRRRDGTPSSSGIQFGVPHLEWWGPATFSRHRNVVKRTRKNRAQQTENRSVVSTERQPVGTTERFPSGRQNGL
jgi:hypothetical protein